MLYNFKKYIYLFFLLAFVSCTNTSTFSYKYGEINAQKVLRIELKNSKRADCPQSIFQTIITDKQVINKIVTSINDSSIDGPWKGACWDQIIIVGQDSTIRLSTNGNVFGFGASGMFFKFSNPELLTKIGLHE